MRLKAENGTIWPPALRTWRLSRFSGVIRCSAEDWINTRAMDPL